MANIGLYGLKPWYAARLRPVRGWLAARGVSPAAVTYSGVVAGAVAGTAMATLPAGIGLGFVVAAALAARLACANLDGALARDAGRGTAWGSVVNEVGDRLAEIAALAGLFFVAPAWQVIAAIAAASAPSWIALAGSTAGTARIQGGPVGKTERTVVLVLAAFTGGWVAALALVIGGSLVTALVRLATLRRLLASAASR